MVFGLGQRKQAVDVNGARAEVRFWKYELDRCVDEKNKWIERFRSAARHNEMLRAEVLLIQRDTSTLRQHSAWKQHLSSAAAANSGRSEQHTPAPARREAAHTGSVAAPLEQDTDFIPTPASKRFQAPGSGSKSTARYSNMDNSSKLRDEVDSLKQLLQEAHAQNSSLKGEVERQQQQNEFLTASVEAYKNETKLLREELLTQHGINDETADETVKVLSELGRLQQANALLMRDMSLKDSMIQLLQQELCDLTREMPPTPRARSPERNSSSSSSGGSDHDAMILQSLWEMEQQQQLLWEAEQPVPVPSGRDTYAAPEGRGFEQASALYLDLPESSGEALGDERRSQPAAAADQWGSDRQSQPGGQDSGACPYPHPFSTAGQSSSADVHCSRRSLGADEALSPTASSTHSVDTLTVPDVDPAQQWPSAKASIQPYYAKTVDELSGVSATPQRLCPVSDSDGEDDVGRRVGIRTPDSYGHRFAALQGAAWCP